MNLWIKKIAHTAMSGKLIGKTILSSTPKQKAPSIKAAFSIVLKKKQ